VDGMPRLRPSDGRVLASPAPVPGAAAPAPDSQPWQS